MQLHFSTLFSSDGVKRNLGKLFQWILSNMWSAF